MKLYKWNKNFIKNVDKVLETVYSIKLSAKHLETNTFKTNCSSKKKKEILKSS